jgi:cytochrome c oxidase cbb3-type subunit 3
MSLFSRRPKLVGGCLALVAAVLGACQREHRDYADQPPPQGPSTLTQASLSPGGPVPHPADPRGARYESNAYHIGQGQRLYRWFNCEGCHAAGGGDIGPALMDDQWRYGGDMDHIYDSIARGRPNGMPAFGDRLTAQQIWQLASYVRTLSGNVREDAVPSRNEGASSTPPLTQMPPQPPKNTDPTSTQEPQQ